MATSLNQDPRSLPSLLGEVVRDLFDLIRQEIALAKTEASDRLASLQAGLAALAVGGAVAFAGFLVLLDACVFALGNVMGDLVTRFPALPALIVGLVVVVAGIVLLKAGLNKFAAHHLRLTRTMEAVSKDRALVEEHLR